MVRARVLVERRDDEAQGVTGISARTKATTTQCHTFVLIKAQCLHGKLQLLWINLTAVIEWSTVHGISSHAPAAGALDG